MTQISQAAKDALINAGTNRQGAKVQGSAEALAELAVAGLIGPEHGLTRKGTIARERAEDEAFAKAFG